MKLYRFQNVFNEPEKRSKFAKHSKSVQKLTETRKHPDCAEVCEVVFQRPIEETDVNIQAS